MLLITKNKLINKLSETKRPISCAKYKSIDVINQKLK